MRKHKRINNKEDGKILFKIVPNLAPTNIDGANMVAIS